MEYNINLLAQKYAEYLDSHTMDVTLPQTDLNFSAYNDLEYLDTIKTTQSEFENVEDIAMYEKFLRGE